MRLDWRPVSLALALLVTFLVLPDDAHAQDRPYEETTVWDISYVKTTPGNFNNYLRDLAAGWKRVNDEAMNRGYIESYKILTGQAGHPGDWDLMLLIEYENMAALDGAFEKFDPMIDEIFGGMDDADQATVVRSQLREILGGKLAREIVLK
ncbi:MAG: hypothetical protein R3199_02780 [Gemmatimonadota bacterium]|nr:hypothetical protein [Gemmatimonadota bacterium]